MFGIKGKIINIKNESIVLHEICKIYFNLKITFFEIKLNKEIIFRRNYGYKI